MAEHQVSTPENGARITVHVRDVIALHLPENATTGYRWAIASLDEARFVVEDSGYRQQGQAVGSGGEAYWKLRARSAGETRIELVNKRAWEGDRSIIERFAIDTIVEPER